MKKSDVFEIKALLWFVLSFVADGGFAMFALFASAILLVVSLFLMWREK